MKRIAFIFIFFISSVSVLRAQGDIAEGGTIFKSRCASCHAIDKRVVGPALKDVYNRHDEKWIINFVHSSQTVIKSGNEVAVKLFEEYNQTVMPDHKDLTEAQIKSILAYIKDQSVNAPVTASKGWVPDYTKPYTNKKGIIDRIVYLNFDEPQRPIKSGDTVAWLLIATIIIILTICFYVITYSNHIIEVFINDKKKETKNKNIEGTDLTAINNEEQN